ncbi:hypothetical protein U3516DRAFT_787033 [Neocallimastix sp. 'constans']
MIKDYKVAYATFNPKICSNMNITNESISKEGQENITLIQKEKENIKEISNNFSNHLDKTIEAWDNLRNVFINKSNKYYLKQSELISQKNEYISNNNIKIKNNKIYINVLSLMLKIAFIIYIITLLYQYII